MRIAENQQAIFDAIKADPVERMLYASNPKNPDSMCYVCGVGFKKPDGITQNEAAMMVLAGLLMRRFPGVHGFWNLRAIN